MPGSVDLPATFQVVSGWLHGMGMSQVSHFVFLHLIDADVLDLEHYRYDLHPATSMPGSNNPIGTYGVSLGWLRKSGTSAVSDFVFSRLIDTNALNLESSIFAPRLPQHPGYEGKYLHPSDSLSRSP